MFKYKIHKKSSHRAILFVLVSVVSLMVLGGLVIYRASHKSAVPISTISGPTEQEKKEVEQHKQDLSNEVSKTENKPDVGTKPTYSNESTQSNSSKKTVSVTISYAGPSGSSYTVNAFVSGVVESGGTCTLTLSKEGSSTVSVTNTAFDNVSTTNCAPLSVSNSQLVAGTWTANVAYTSTTSQGNENSTLVVN